MFTSNLLLRIKQYILAIIKCRISLDWEHFCLIIVSVLLWNSIALNQSPLLFTILSSSCVEQFNINHRHLLEPIVISNIFCVKHVGVVCVSFFFLFCLFFSIAFILNLKNIYHVVVHLISHSSLHYAFTLHFLCKGLLNRNVQFWNGFGSRFFMEIKVL